MYIHTYVLASELAQMEKNSNSYKCRRSKDVYNLLNEKIPKCIIHLVATAKVCLEAYIHMYTWVRKATKKEKSKMKVWGNAYAICGYIHIHIFIYVYIWQSQRAPGTWVAQQMCIIYRYICKYVWVCLFVHVSAVFEKSRQQVIRKPNGKKRITFYICY